MNHKRKKANGAKLVMGALFVSGPCDEVARTHAIKTRRLFYKARAVVMFDRALNLEMDRLDDMTRMSERMT